MVKILRASSRPYFGAYTFLESEKIIIWKGKKSQVKIFGVPGQIFSIDKKYYVCCKDGAIEIEEWSMSAQKERTLNQMRFLK